MKTRTLLLLAVGCGLIILLAGGIKLLLVADADRVPHLALGTSATVGDMTVTVESFQQRSGVGAVIVTLVGVDDPDGATTWVFGTGDAQLTPNAGAEAVEPRCQATQRSVATRCVLSFVTPATEGVLRYQRAGETIRWDIGERTG